MSTKSGKLESLFKHRINRAIKEKEEKRKRKLGDGKKEKIKKNLRSLSFYTVFDCIRDFERLKMVACPKTNFFAMWRRFVNAMPENPVRGSDQ